MYRVNANCFDRFSSYLIRPQDEKRPILACALTVFIGVATLGSIHIVCSIYRCCRAKKHRPEELSEEDQKVQIIVTSAPNSPLHNPEIKKGRSDVQGIEENPENEETLRITLEKEGKRQDQIKELKLSVETLHKAVDEQRNIQDDLFNAHEELKKRRQIKSDQLQDVKRRRLENEGILALQNELSKKTAESKREKEGSLQDPKFESSRIEKMDEEFKKLAEYDQTLSDQFNTKVNEKNQILEKSNKLQNELDVERKKLKKFSLKKKNLTKENQLQQEIDNLGNEIKKIDEEKGVISKESNAHSLKLQDKMKEINLVKAQKNDLELAIQKDEETIRLSQEKINRCEQEEQTLSREDETLSTDISEFDKELNTLVQKTKHCEEEQKRLTDLLEGVRKELIELGVVLEIVFTDESTILRSPKREIPRLSQTLAVKTPPQRQSGELKKGSSHGKGLSPEVEHIEIKVRTPRKSLETVPSIEVLKTGKFTLAELQEKQKLLDEENPFLSETGLYKALNNEAFFNEKIAPALKLLARFGISKNAHEGWVKRLDEVKKIAQEGDIDKQHHGEIVSLFVYLALSILEEYGGTAILSQGLDFFRKAYTHELPNDKGPATDFKPLLKQLTELKMPAGDFKIPFGKLPPREKAKEMVSALMKNGKWDDKDLALLKTICPNEFFDKSWLPHFQLVFFLAMVGCKELVEQIGSEKELRDAILDIGIKDLIPPMAISGLEALEWKIVGLGSSLVPTDKIVNWIPFPTKAERELQDALNACKKEILRCDASINAKTDVENSKKKKVDLNKTKSELEGKIKLEAKKPKSKFEIEKTEFQKSMLKELIGGFRTRHATSFLSYLKVVLRFLYVSQAIEDYACKPTDEKAKTALQDKINEMFSMGMRLIPAFAKESAAVQKDLPMDSYATLLEAANEVIANLEIPENLLETEWVNWLQEKLFNPFSKKLDEVDNSRVSVGTKK